MTGWGLLWILLLDLLFIQLTIELWPTLSPIEEWIAILQLGCERLCSCRRRSSLVSQQRPFIDLVQMGRFTKRQCLKHSEWRQAAGFRHLPGRGDSP